MNDSPSYAIVSASITGTNKIGPRSLLFYPVSLHNALHGTSNLAASMEVIREMRHPNTGFPSLVIHVTDRIYAYNFMAQDPTLNLAEARELADHEGIKWVNENLTSITQLLGFQPVVMHWRQWEDAHADEYQDALSKIRALYETNSDTFNKKFYDAVNLDIERFTRGYTENFIGSSAEKSMEIERVRKLSAEFVLQECAGYTLIGRHLTNDYLSVLNRVEPKWVDAISSTGGFSDGIVRLYPGSMLKAIDWLQKSSIVKGVEKVKTVKIQIDRGSTSNNMATRALPYVRLNSSFPDKDGTAAQPLPSINVSRSHGGGGDLFEVRGIKPGVITRFRSALKIG